MSEDKLQRELMDLAHAEPDARKVIVPMLRDSMHKEAAATLSEKWKEMMEAFLKDAGKEFKKEVDRHKLGFRVSVQVQGGVMWLNLSRRADSVPDDNELPDPVLSGTVHWSSNQWFAPMGSSFQYQTLDGKRSIQTLVQADAKALPKMTAQALGRGIAWSLGDLLGTWG